MAEKGVVGNNISEYKGLEILLNYHLRQLKMKSDLIILFTHYILTQVQDYDCVEVKTDYNEEYKSYEVLDVLPSTWNQLPSQYKIIYKHGTNIKVVTGLKKNDSFRLYITKENGDRDQISPEIQLKSYIPDEFFNVNHEQYKDLRSIRHVAEIMNILTRTITGNKKIMFKKLLDEATMSDQKLHIQEIMRENDEDKVVLTSVCDELDEGVPKLALPPSCPQEEEEVPIGEFYIQDPKRHVPKADDKDADSKVRSDDFDHEDIEGAPTSSIYS